MFKAYSRIFLFLLAAFHLSQCDNYEYPKGLYPRLETLPAVNVHEHGVTFQARITPGGNEQIINHGFVWGIDENLSIDSNDKIQLGKNSGNGNFEADITAGLYPNQIYYVKAFVATDKYLVYGKIASFTSRGSMSPVLIELSPAEGTSGDTISIVGKHFSALPKNNIVKFGSLSAKVVDSNDSIIHCVVPDNIPVKSISVSVNVTGYEAGTTLKFTLVSPGIQNFTPFSGTFGDIVTITGQHFSRFKEKNIVQFNEFISEVVEASTTQLKVKVPSTIRARENVVSVTVNLQADNSVNKFSILPPVVTSISASQGFTGSTILISGNNFNPASEGNTVSLAGTSAKILEATKTSLSIEIPQKGIYKSRSFPVEVIVAEQSGVSSEIFTLQDLWLRKSDVPGPKDRYGAVAFAIKDMGYIGLGGGNVGSKFYQYNPSENSYIEVAPFPGGQRLEAISFVIGDYAYVGLGGVNDLWRFDPIGNTWTEMADFPGYEYGVGVAVNGKGYIVTQEQTNNFWEYDPIADDWSQLETYPFVIPEDGLTPTAGFALNDEIYIYSTDVSTAPNPILRYNFETHSWQGIPGVEDEFVTLDATAFAVNGFIYVRGYLQMHKFDPNTQSWQAPVEDVLGVREYSLSFVVNEKVYFGTSWSGVNDLWEFDPEYDH
jgi:hypothetical protein